MIKMTKEQHDIYQKKIQQLQLVKEEAERGTKMIEDSLYEYKRELVALCKKHNVEQQEKMLFNYECQSKDAQNKIISTKIQYVFCIINDCIKDVFNDKEYEATQWITKHFGIKFDFGWDNLPFSVIYNDYIFDDMFDESDWQMCSDKYVIKGQLARFDYWEHFSLHVPENIIANIDTFITNFNREIELFKVQRHKEKMLAEEQAEVERYNLYLKLKKEFGGKND